jgi:two-component system, chemotaxis family, protein-glutamate methylesterase/glutaminase
MLSGLPPDFPAAVFVVQHFGRQVPGTLADLIRAKARLPASFARDGEPIERSRIYVAPPDHHLELTAKKVLLTHGPRHNFSRPSIDVLFRSAAQCHGPRAVGVILTGLLDDGSIGLNSIKVHGGVAIVQDPTEAAASSMPQRALQNTKVDYCLPIAGIAQKLTELAKNGGSSPAPVETKKDNRPMTPEEMVAKNGPPIPYVCPECQGPLWEIGSGVKEYRCHVGHVFTPEVLLQENENQLEQALWSAVRALEEQASLLDRIGSRNAAGDWRERSAEKARQAAALRELLQRPRRWQGSPETSNENSKS